MGYAVFCRPRSQFKPLLAAFHPRLGISILFRHTKVDNVDGVCTLCAGSTDKEVVRFDISVDEVSLVDSLDSGQLKNGSAMLQALNVPFV